MNEIKQLEVSCQTCKSRRNLTIGINPKGTGQEAISWCYCHRHYTDYLQTKIVRLEELVSADKKPSKK